MNRSEITTSKTSVRLDKNLWSRFRTIGEENGFPVITLLNAALRKEIPRIKNAITSLPQILEHDSSLEAEKLSANAKAEIKKQYHEVRDHIKGVNLALANDVLESLNNLCKSHNLVRDAVINRVLLNLVMPTNSWTAKTVFGQIDQGNNHSVSWATPLATLESIYNDPLSSLYLLQNHGNGDYANDPSFSIYHEYFSLGYPKKRVFQSKRGSIFAPTHVTIWFRDIDFEGSKSFEIIEGLGDKMEEAFNELFE